MTQLDRMKAALVKAKEMRAAQRRYFQTRDRSDLDTSKRLERQTDQAIEEALRPDDLLGS